MTGKGEDHVKEQKEEERRLRRRSMIAGGE
jgi:hypothetical protein